ncbi:MAG: putative DNA binding domain-containing protein [Synergistaceae bacterium]|jgi:ATP-dependent DNA helicase RecG|nr:putative DNA binding domain-containing protein [Synergistaceae bacterium]
MEAIELLAILERGENSRHQFKKNLNNSDALTAEFIAFSNGGGGRIFIGVDDSGVVTGLTGEDIRRLNQMISNAASQNVQPAINPVTENIKTGNGLVMVVEVPAGINKPYQDKNGVFWVKNGLDKRKATSRDEIQRMFQKSARIHADEIPVSGVTVADLDLDYFKDFFQKRFGETLDDQILSLPNILENMNLLKNGSLNICCALLFAKSPQYKLPVFIVKAGAFEANDLATIHYNDSRDITGKLSDVFYQTVAFIVSNLHHIQDEQGINSVGKPEISVESIEELVSNALIHRDYFISAPVRVFVFSNRVEIISPGHLPNNLTIENIKSGNSNARNPTLASFANHVLPYRGYGSGIIRALAKYPHIDFVDDREGNLFKVTLRRGQDYFGKRGD